jgi:hypothetical protein
MDYYYIRWRVLKPTPINASQTPTLFTTCSIPLWEKMSVWAHGVMSVVVISGATTYRLPLPPCMGSSQRASLNLGSVQGGFTVVCQCLFLPCFSREGEGRGNGWSPQNQGGGRPTKPRGSVLKMQWDGFTTKSGGIMEVAMSGFDIAWF